MTTQFPVWPEWKTVRMLGNGSFGAVYEIERDMMGETEKAALKVISIPQNTGDIDTLYSEGYDADTITATFQEHLKSILDEYRLMRKLNGCTNVVNCDDVRYIQHDDGIGWDIYIKMELLTPLIRALPDQITDADVIKIGVDMSNALALCAKHNIIHRDIKPQNIFVSDNGDYKLGDFGIAKTVEKTMGGTKTGTYKYMAPEVYNNQPYGASADIYSLGIVLYWLLNERRLPFLPLPPAKLTASMDEDARLRRMRGETIPAPKNGSEELKKLVLKACAYHPKDRFHSAEELLAAFDNIGKGKPATSINWGKWGGLSAAIVAAVLIPVLFLRQQPSAPEPETIAVQTTAPVTTEHAEPSDAAIEITAPETTPQEVTEPIPEETARPVLPVYLMKGSEDLSDIDEEELGMEPIWGQRNYTRNEIEDIVFLNTLDSAPSNAWDVSASRNKTVLAWKDSKTLIIAADGIVGFPTNSDWLFAGFTNLVSIDFGNNIDTSSVTSMARLFASCISLRELDVTGFCTDNVRNMEGIFSYCPALRSLDLSGWNTSKVTDMHVMFYGCKSLQELNLSGMETGEVTSMKMMFENCKQLTSLDLHSFDTRNVTNMDFMFYGCSGLTELDLSSFETPKLRNMSSMFYHCSNLETLDLRNFDTSHTLNMRTVFTGCDKLTVDVSHFDTSTSVGHQYHDGFMDKGWTINGEPWHKFFKD